MEPIKYAEFIEFHEFFLFMPAFLKESNIRWCFIEVWYYKLIAILRRQYHILENSRKKTRAPIG